VNLHNHQLYLLKQHSESFKIWSAIIRINPVGRSLIIKVGLSPTAQTKVNIKKSTSTLVLIVVYMFMSVMNVWV